MLAILEFVLWLFVLPYVLFGLLLFHVARTVSAMFQPHLLLAGVWFAMLGGWLSSHSTPDESRQFVTLAESIAQGHLGPVAIPDALFGVGAALVIASALVAFLTKRAAR